MLILKLLGISFVRSLWVRYTSFTAQPFDLPSWLYVCLLGLGLYGNLTRHLDLYQVTVGRLDRFATPLPSPQACDSLHLSTNTRGQTFTDKMCAMPDTLKKMLAILQAFISNSFDYF